MGKKRIAIVTDSNSGITQAQGREMGITVIAMPFYINEQLFLEDITLTQEEFYKRLEEGADISTSQPSPADVMELWETLLQNYEEVVHIPMSSGLSNSCQTAMVLSREFKGRVQVVDNQRISVTQRQSVLDAMTLAQAGKSAAQIKEILEREAHESSIYITLETLKYLKKGGRITPAAAALGTVLNLKPVLQIQGERLDAFSKARGKKQAKKIMIKAMEKRSENQIQGVYRQRPDVSGGSLCRKRGRSPGVEKRAGEKFRNGSLHGASVLKCVLSYRTGSIGSGRSEKSGSGVVRKDENNYRLYRRSDDGSI